MGEYRCLSCGGRHLRGTRCPALVVHQTDMRIVVPFAQTVADGVLERIHPGFGVPELHDVSADDDAYYRLLCELWAAGRTFVIVEHDVGVGPDSLGSFTRCLQSWCFVVYGYEGELFPAGGLGCTRFRSELMAREPDLLDAVGEHVFEGVLAHWTESPRNWRVLDAAVSQQLHRRGYRAHYHRRHPASHLPSVRRPVAAEAFLNPGDR